VFLVPVVLVGLPRVMDVVDVVPSSMPRTTLFNLDVLFLLLLVQAVQLVVVPMVKERKVEQLHLTMT
jgi:hypothetical protein